MIGIRAIAWASLLALGVSSAEHQTRPSAKPSNYTNQAIGLSMVPPTFKIPPEQTVTSVASFSAPTEDGFSANINIQVHGLRFDDFIKTSDAQFQSPGIEVISRKEVRIGTRPACEWVYKMTVQGHRAKFIGLAVDKGDYVVLVTATSLAQSFDKNEPWMRDALSSVKLDQ